MKIISWRKWGDFCSLFCMRKFTLGLLIEIMMQKTKTAEFCVELCICKVYQNNCSLQLKAF
jgi:hypothetical protein